eukprot:250972-Hanusia_phi.AAC.1
MRPRRAGTGGGSGLPAPGVHGPGRTRPRRLAPDQPARPRTVTARSPCPGRHQPCQCARPPFDRTG